MEIELAEPVFKCKNDEEVFFQRLSEISGFQEVVKINRQLYVSVFEGDHQLVLDQIQNICTIWHTCLKQDVESDLNYHGDCRKTVNQ